jgi:hypothetical protein
MSSHAGKSPAIYPYSPTAECWFDEGCYINELAHRPDDPAASIAQARVPAACENLEPGD